MVSIFLVPLSYQNLPSNGFWLLFLTIEFEVTKRPAYSILRSVSNRGTEKLEGTQTFMLKFTVMFPSPPTDINLFFSCMAQLGFAPEVQESR